MPFSAKLILLTTVVMYMFRFLQCVCVLIQTNFEMLRTLAKEPQLRLGLDSMNGQDDVSLAWNVFGTMQIDVSEKRKLK